MEDEIYEDLKATFEKTFSAKERSCARAFGPSKRKPTR